MGFLLSAKTIQTAHLKYIGAMVFNFLICIVWIIGIQEMHKAGRRESLIYATGSTLGTALGIFVSGVFSN